MKAFTIIMKILAAAAAVVGAVYVAATYGDKIVAWAKKMLPECPCCKKEEAEEAPVEEAVVVEEVPVEEAPAEEAPAEEAPAEEAPAEEAPAEEAPVEEVPAEEDAPVADEADFEG